MSSVEGKMDDFEDIFQRSLGLRDEHDDIVDRLYPNLPDWVKREYSSKEWLWLPHEERYAILNGSRCSFNGFDGDDKWE